MVLGDVPTARSAEPYRSTSALYPLGNLKWSSFSSYWLGYFGAEHMYNHRGRRRFFGIGLQLTDPTLSG